ncbi:MAG: IclR family transcriptional regulator C-terminal domain-containing protein, partial [Chloroflexota bacterium]
TRYTDRTILDADVLKTHLKHVRDVGYALDDEELTPGVRGLAAPIRNREGRTVAAMGLSGPGIRLTDEKIPELVQQLTKTAMAVSAKLGFQAD